MESNKIYHFYHLWLGGPWIEIFHNHLNTLKDYGLMDRINMLYIGLVGNVNERAVAKRFLNILQIKHIIIAEADSGYEQVTQNALYEFSKDNDGYVLYAHNKGSSSPSEINVAWRKSMTYHNIVLWQQAVSYLTMKDAVGCHWLTPESYSNVFMPYFAGTFWWTHLSLIRTLGYPDNNSRYDAEVWIGKYPNINVHDLAPGWPGYDVFTITW